MKKGYNSKHIFEYSNIHHPKTKHTTDIDNHYFNHGIDIIFPEIMKIPEKVSNCLEDYEYYKVHKVSLPMFLEREFIEAFVKKGHMYILSTDGNMDLDNCLVLLPTGKLILNITKDLYEELGLEGKPPTFLDLHKKKYVVEVDLVSASFVVGRKLYERTVNCFNRCSKINFNCLIHWIPPDSNICSSSIAIYFCNKGLDVKMCQSESSNFLRYSTLMPLVKSSNWDGSDESSDYKEFTEWIGGIACNVDWDESNDDFISTYRIPEPNIVASQIAVHQWRGFIPSTYVNSIFKELQSYIEESSSPWVAIIIHGFQDCPIPCGSSEHKFHNNNDDSLIFIIFPNGDYWKYNLF